MPDDLKKMVLDGPKNGHCSYGMRPAMGIYTKRARRSNAN
jgi:hypothetical protein